MLILPSYEDITVALVGISQTNSGNSLQYTVVHSQLHTHIPPFAWDFSGYLIHEVREVWFSLQTSWIFAA